MLRGGAGNDTFRARDGRRDVVEGGRGSDTAIADRTLDRLVSIERRRFSNDSTRPVETAASPAAGRSSSIAAMALVRDHARPAADAGLAEIDPDIAALLGEELERQRDQIELIASENFTWPSVLEAVGSVPTNKYAEGYPGKRYYGGCEVVDQIEQLAIDRAKALFGAEHANVQPHAGAQANMAVYLGLMQPGDTVLSLRLDHGGHLTHGLKVNFSGRLYTIAHYGVSRETSLVDYDEVLALAKEHRPKVILCGGSAYPRTVETWEFRKIADEVGALLWCDMAHFSGPRRGRAAPEPGGRLRRRHLDDPQDARRAARRVHPLPRGARVGDRPRRLPGPPGRPARARDRREGDLLQDRRLRRRSASTRRRCARTPTRSPPRSSTGGSTC